MELPHLMRNDIKVLSRIFFVLSILAFTLNTSAQFTRDQLNLADHDDKFYHVGIAFIYNNSHFQVSAHPQFLQSDSVLSVNPLNTGGFGLAGLHTFHLSPHWEFRIVFPQLMFSYKNLM